MNSENKPIGYLYAFIAYFTWGFVPIYWKLLKQIGFNEILGHRIIWAAIILAILLKMTSGFSEFKSIFKDKTKLMGMLAATFLIFFNWNLFIWGVTHSYIVECSLGYFINPMINILLGIVVLKEKMKISQWPSVILAILGITFLFSQGVGKPWISILLAFSFAIYGLIRKKMQVSPTTGLFFETSTLFFPILIYFFNLSTKNEFHTLHASSNEILLLMGAGLVTVVPLLAFNHAVKNLKFITVGFFQYMTPTIQLIIGVLMYHESFTDKHVIAFSLIWIGLIVYTISEVVQNRKLKKV